MMSSVTQIPELAPLSDPLSLARISVLLVPVGDISRATWDKWTFQIRRFTELRLNDVPGTSGGPASKGDKARFLPPSSPPPSTHVHLSFTTVPPTNDLSPLSLLQISAFPLAVIGVSDLSDTRTNHNQKIGQFQKVLNDLHVNHANGMIYPLARRCFGVEEDVSAFPLGSTPKAGNFPKQNKSTPNLPDSSSSTPRRVEQSATFEGMVEIDASDGSNVQRPKSQMADRDAKMYDRKGHEEKMVVIPKDGNVEIVLGMLMADLVASVLTEFGDMISALEKPTGTQTLQASMLPILTVKGISRPIFTTPSNASAGESIPRPRSSNYSLISVSNTANPTTPTSSFPSRPSSATGYTIPGISGSSSMPTLPEHSDRSSARPQSVIGTTTFGGDAALRGFGNVPGPTPARPDSKNSGNATKRASTGFSLSTSMGRVMSGSKHISSPIEVGSSTSPIAGASSNTSASSGAGRLRKVTADLWLLSGRLQEAITSYHECISTFKSHNDSIWHASACEGLATATLLEAWETRNPEHGNVPLLTSPVLSGAHEFMTQALGLYGRSSCPPESLFPHGAESGEGVMARLYTLCALRTARLLLHAWAAGGFGAASLQSLVSARLPRSYPPMDYAHRRRVFLKLTTMSKISRSLVTRTATAAHGPWIRCLPEDVQLDILVELANFQRILGLDRREMIFDRELSGSGVTAIMKARTGQAQTEVETKRRRNSDASILSQDSTASTELDDRSMLSARNIGVPPHTSSSNGGFIASKRPDSEEGTDAIIYLLHRTLDILGLDLDLLYDAPGTVTCPDSSYGWPELQVEVVRDAVAAVEALPDHLNIMRFAAVALRTMSMHLAPHSQLYLYQAYARAWSTAQRRAITLPPRQWWIPDGLVVGLDITPIPLNKIPYEQSLATATAKDQRLDPFLYNPRAKTSAGGKLVFVQNEAIECIVTLANPFSFDIELQDVALATTGVPTNCPALPLVLTADNVVRVPLLAVATEPGELALQGIRVRLPDGQEEILTLPHASMPGPAPVPAKPQLASKSIAAANLRPSLQRMDNTGHPQANRTSGPIHCQVIPAQPLMWIRGTNLNHGSLITLDGEMFTIRLVIENASSQTIDFLKLTFTDTLAEEGERLLNETGLDLVQIHAIETELRQRPVLLWEQADQPIHIPPGAQQTVAIRYLGKVGCEHAIVRMDYGNIAGARRNGNASFYSRRITLPIITTVQQTLRCRTLDIQTVDRVDVSLAVTPATTPGQSQRSRVASARITPRHQSSFRNDRASQDHLQNALSSACNQPDFCIASALFTNPSDQALEVCLERRQEGVESLNTEPLLIRRLLAAGASARVFFPVRRCTLSREEASRPIPQSNARQFVVSKKAVTETENMRFWLKEDLLKSFRAWWTLPGSNRSGELGFRNLEIDQRAIEAFRQELLSIDIDVDSNDDVGKGVSANEPTKLRLSVKLHSPEGVTDECKATYTISVQPYTLDRTANHQSAYMEIDALSRNFIHEGKLKGSLALQKGFGCIDVRSTFLSRGLYELDATVVLDDEHDLAGAPALRKHTTRIVRII